MLSESESSWVEVYLRPRYPELVEGYVEARGIVFSAQSTKHLATVDVQRLVAMAQSERKPLGENVSCMLGELAVSFPQAQDALRQLALSPAAHCRINALAALDSFPPSALHFELIERLLQDKSTKVRALAASKALSCGARGLLSALGSAIEREKNPELRAELEWNRSLLRDGYISTTREDGSVWVTCRRGGGVISASFPADQFESKGRQWIAENVR